jgi:hypothetical protein
MMRINRLTTLEEGGIDPGHVEDFVCLFTFDGLIIIFFPSDSVLYDNFHMFDFRVLFNGLFLCFVLFSLIFK